MKIYRYCIAATIILLLSCKTTQQLIVDNKNYNIIIIKFNETNTVSTNYNLYSKNDILITSLGHSKDFNPKFQHLLLLKKGKDTMKLNCTFPVYQNFYLKNVDFKKGSYLLEYNNSKNGFLNNTKLEKVNGKEIKTPTSTQNIIFKNISIIDSIDGNRFKDILFKDILFNVVNFSDNSIKLEFIKEE
jgi:hypothetical protein